MAISNVSSVDFKANAVPAFKSESAATEAAPVEKKSHTGLYLLGGAAAAALAAIMLYRKKGGAKAADAVKDAAEETGKKAKEAVTDAVDKTVKDVKKFWEKHAPESLKKGTSLNVSGTENKISPLYKDSKLVGYELKNKDGKLISKFIPGQSEVKAKAATKTTKAVKGKKAVPAKYFGYNESGKIVKAEILSADGKSTTQYLVEYKDGKQSLVKKLTLDSKGNVKEGTVLKFENGKAYYLGEVNASGKSSSTPKYKIKFDEEGKHITKVVLPKEDVTPARKGDSAKERLADNAKFNQAKQEARKAFEDFKKEVTEALQIKKK